MIAMLEEFSRGKVMTVVKQGRGEQASAERTFNFIGELTVLVDYQVIAKYFWALRHP